MLVIKLILFEGQASEKAPGGLFVFEGNASEKAPGGSAVNLMLIVRP
jgi:hypothetical protein